jgi:hypothetical protein
VKYLVSSKSASKCLGSVSRALRYLTASFILLRGLEGRSGHLLKERLVFLQKSMCLGVLTFKSPARAIQFSCVVSEFDVVLCKVPMSRTDSQQIGENRARKG